MWYALQLLYVEYRVTCSLTAMQRTRRLPKSNIDWEGRCPAKICKCFLDACPTHCNTLQRRFHTYNYTHYSIVGITHVIFYLSNYATLKGIVKYSWVCSFWGELEEAVLKITHSDLLDVLKLWIYYVLDWNSRCALTVWHKIPTKSNRTYARYSNTYIFNTKSSIKQL